MRAEHDGDGIRGGTVEASGVHGVCIGGARRGHRIGKT